MALGGADADAHPGRAEARRSGAHQHADVQVLHTHPLQFHVGIVLLLTTSPPACSRLLTHHTSPHLLPKGRAPPPAAQRNFHAAVLPCTMCGCRTGRIPFHTLQHLVGYGSATKPSCTGLQLNYTLLPELLRSKTYHCAHVVRSVALTHGLPLLTDVWCALRAFCLQGKWHTGAWARDYLPTSRGFHESLAYLCLSGRYDHYTQQGHFYCPSAVDLWLNEGPARAWNGTYDAEMYSRFAVDVIQRHARRQQRAAAAAAVAPAELLAPRSPLYLHVEYHVVHEPVQSPQRYQSRYPNVTNECRKAYCGMLSALDDGIANITKALRAAGMHTNLVTVVVSDNGGLVSGSGGCGSNFPLRGGKHSFFAGGIQGIALVHSPLLPPSVAGSVFGGLSAAADLYPTLAKLAGITELSNTGFFPVDGIDLWPYLTGQRRGNAHHELLVSGCRQGAGPCNGAMFSGELKLIVGKQQPAGWYRTPGERHAADKSHDAAADDDCSSGPCVFNMTDDPTERRNLAAEDPGRFAALVRRFEQLSAVTVPQDRGTSECTAAAMCAQVHRNGGFFGPWGNTSAGHGFANRSCACPSADGFHFAGSTLLATIAGGNASTCQQRCCTHGGCDGWIFQAYQIKGNDVCAQGRPCCYLRHGTKPSMLEPKLNCTAGLMSCTNSSRMTMNG